MSEVSATSSHPGFPRAERTVLSERADHLAVVGLRVVEGPGGRERIEAGEVDEELEEDLFLLVQAGTTDGPLAVTTGGDRGPERTTDGTILLGGSNAMTLLGVLIQEAAENCEQQGFPVASVVETMREAVEDHRVQGQRLALDWQQVVRHTGLEADPFNGG